MSERGTLAHICRYRWADAIVGKPEPNEPYVFDCKMYDIPNTMRAAIRNARPNVVAITFGRGIVGARSRRLVEQECRRKGIRAIWW